MNAIQDEPASLETAADLAPSPPLLRTLVACDLVESTALAQQLGDRSIADVMHLLDRHARDLLQRHGGQEIDKTDGFLLMFDRPVQAIAFALDYQRLLHDLTLSEFLPLKARIGIHVGDVVLWRNSSADIARGAKPLEVEGLVKPVAARLMGLALPGQILMSGVARALALRAQDELEIEFPPEWRMHGRYAFKGVAEPVPVFEVGETGIAPLRPPAYSSKASRETPWWRRPGLLAMEAAVLLAAIVIPAWIFLRSPPVIAFAERDWIVVGSLKNLTDEHRFDDALDTAFRLGLEQSRFVNVLSDLKVRETVKLMQRDPDKVSVDRTVGSEVVVRNGARALILPTVVEVGRNVRVTAEVVDPNSEATVYSESAEGVGAESVLHSVDMINEHLRERLGEALASVAKDSQPLERAATGNLDALRAYSLARAAYNRDSFVESLHLTREALKLDPNFALARIHLARLLLTTDDDRKGAIEELTKALEGRESMSPRDALYAEAWRDTLVGPYRPALEKWKMLAKLYPDFFTAQSLFAYYSFKLANRADADVVAAAESAAARQNPYPNSVNGLLGNLYLHNQQIDRASEKFAIAERDSTTNLFDSALPYAVAGQFDKVDATLQRGKLADVQAATLGLIVPRVAIAYDRGQHEKAFELLTEGRKQAAATDLRYVAVFTAIELGLEAIAEPRGSLTSKLDAYVGAARSALTASVDDSERLETQCHLLFAAYLAARIGDTTLAATLLKSVGPQAESGDWPVARQMLLLARAQLLLAEHKPNEAIDTIKPSVDGSELFLTHEVLWAAYLAASNTSDANEQMQWLINHRGRAYVEESVRGMLVPLNVAASNRARERASERAPVPKS